MKLLQEGAVIELKVGHIVYYGDTERDDVRITNQTPDLAGKYIVVKTTFDGGFTGHGYHDVYPDGHHVWCEKIMDGNQNPIRVHFYQTGCFIAMNTDVPVVGYAIKSWKII